MIIILLFLLFISVQILLAVFWPAGLIYLSLLTGAVPFNLGREGMLVGVFGKMDLSAIRLLGLWLACSIVIVLHLGNAWKYFIRYQFHFLFLLFCSLTLLWAPSLTYGARMIAKLSAPILFLLLVMLMISSRSQLKLMEKLILFGGASILLIAIVSRVFGVGRLTGNLTLPGIGEAVFSAYLVAVTMLALAKIKYSNPSRNIILVGFLVAGIIAAFSRSTIGALFVGSSLILFMSHRGIPRLILPALGVIGLPTLFLFSEKFKQRMFLRADKVTLTGIIDDPSGILNHVRGSGRFAAWDYALEHFFQPSPIVGSGIGSTQNYYYSQSLEGISVVHSEYVRLLAELGLVGLALFIVAIIAYAVRLIHTWRVSPRSEAGKYALAAMGGLAAYLVYMATGNPFDYVNAFGIYIFSLIGMSEKARELDIIETGVPEQENRLYKFQGSGETKSRFVPKRERKYQIIYSE